MKTEWDYTELAAAYVDRPDYAVQAIEEMLRLAVATKGSSACDVGAGVAHLTIPLLQHGLIVDAVEPNDAMRTLGIKRTLGFSTVRWFEGTAEETGRPSKSYDLVTFGSSFNVTDRSKALKETSRLLKPGGWFACMWNHRDLEDPLQRDVEKLISTQIPGYAYGSRREDQTDVIRKSGLFEEPRYVEGRIVHSVSQDNWIEAWRSHATLSRQAGTHFVDVIQEIENYVRAKAPRIIPIPYVTRMWVAQIKK